MENIAEAYMADIKGGGPVTEEKIRLVAESFAREAKKFMAPNYMKLSCMDHVCGGILKKTAILICLCY